jgi:excisionase family DNA binding protein
MAEPWTSVDDVARHLGVAKDSIYRWIDRRNLPGHRIGRLWKFKLSEVDDWVRAGGANDVTTATMNPNVDDAVTDVGAGVAKK